MAVVEQAALEQAPRSPYKQLGIASLLGAVYVLFAVQFHVLLRRIGDFGLATAALFPLVLVAFLGLFARSVVLTLGPGRVRWRGRVVSVGRSR